MSAAGIAWIVAAAAISGLCSITFGYVLSERARGRLERRLAEWERGDRVLVAAPDPDGVLRLTEATRAGEVAAR